MRIPNQKFIFRVQTTRLAPSFDASTRSVTHTGAEIFLCKAMCNPAVFLQTAWINPGPKVLTHSLPVYEILVLGNHPLSCYSCATLQLHNLPANCARQLFNSNLRRCTKSSCLHQQKIWKLWIFFFVDDIISGVCFWPFWPMLPGPGCQPLKGNFWLKFLLEISYNLSLLSFWSAF